MNESTIRVLLIDDHLVLREGLRALLNSESDMLVVAEGGTAQEAVMLTVEVKPDVVIMDLGIPGGGGLSAIKEIREKELPVRIVVLSMHSGREAVTEAIQAGSDGYVPKSSAHINLLRAIRVVHAGERFLHPTAASAVFDEILDKQKEFKLLGNLSDREADVLKFTAMGFSSREIGVRLSISPKTVETYRQRAMVKLNLEHRSEVIKFALRAGLLEELEKD